MYTLRSIDSLVHSSLLGTLVNLVHLPSFQVSEEENVQTSPYKATSSRKVSTSHLLPQTSPTILLTQIPLKYRKRHPQSKQQQSISLQYSRKAHSREVNWILANPIPKQLQTLIIPVSDIRRYIGIIERLFGAEESLYSFGTRSLSLVQETFPPTTMTMARRKRRCNGGGYAGVKHDVQGGEKRAMVMTLIRDLNK
ncbi:hypothetical protein K457DRAFT_29884 [Linnemannia elongata AG-77]|uniref:Uncharacterized protein n=1 Tax=Linnemannia elongata AG-77 TaxID=1314771 RepID=A0A197K4P4_9FUNG|nr:hypothetical protein K457DRAFT_29884 [Linnemannia elongata AG-77]